jgi:hypothetical protein
VTWPQHFLAWVALTLISFLVARFVGLTGSAVLVFLFVYAFILLKWHDSKVRKLAEQLLVTNALLGDQFRALQRQRAMLLEAIEIIGPDHPDLSRSLSLRLREITVALRDSAQEFNSMYAPTFDSTKP